MRWRTTIHFRSDRGELLQPAPAHLTWQNRTPPRLPRRSRTLDPIETFVAGGGQQRMRDRGPPEDMSADPTQQPGQDDRTSLTVHRNQQRPIQIADLNRIRAPLLQRGIDRNVAVELDVRGKPIQLDPDLGTVGQIADMPPHCVGIPGQGDLGGVSQQRLVVIATGHRASIPPPSDNIRVGNCGICTPSTAKYDAKIEPT